MKQGSDGSPSEPEQLSTEHSETAGDETPELESPDAPASEPPPSDADDDDADDDDADDDDADDDDADDGVAEPALPELVERFRKPLAIIQRSAELVVALAASVCFGLSFGLNYGVSNQVVYLLGAQNLVHPELYRNDWLVQQTTHYHPVFKYFSAALLMLDGDGWAIAYALTATATLGALTFYWLCKLLIPRGGLAAALATITIATVVGTRAVAVTYLFDFILQPSSLGALGLLMAAAFMVQGRYLYSGIALAAGGMFHANYLILGTGAFAFAHLLLGRDGWWRRMLRQLAPPAVMLVLFLPLILSTAASDQTEAARKIYFEIRAPHHFSPAAFRNDFPGFVAWHLLGFAGLVALGLERERVRRCAALIAGTLAVVWTGIFFATAVPVSAAMQAFPWRLSPLGQVLLQVAFCCGALHVASSSEARRNVSPTMVAAAVSGFGYFGVVHALTGKPSTLWKVVATVAAVSVALALVRILGTTLMDWRAWALPPLVRRWRVTALASGALALGFIGEHSYDILSDQPEAVDSRSNLKRGIHQHEAELYAWMREKSPVDAVFLSPPHLEAVRFRGRRAIIVDWKSNPVVPDELVEWLERLKDVTGRPQFSSSRDLHGYARLDAQRLKSLMAKYRIDFVIVRRGTAPRLGKYPIAFENRAFSVVDVRSSKAGAT